jgi:hypothetical protein
MIGIGFTVGNVIYNIFLLESPVGATQVAGSAMIDVGVDRRVNEVR